MEKHRESILELRRKNYSWREIAGFLSARGVLTDHTKVYRFITKGKPKGDFMIPTAQQYERALTTIQPKLTEGQRQMLEAHFRAHNRTITYTQLSEAAKFDGYGAANLWYGQLGADLGKELNFTFADAEERPGETFYSSALGMKNAYQAGPEFELVMHHELAKALKNLSWFQE